MKLATSSPRDTADGRSTRWDQHRATRRRALVKAARAVIHAHGADVSMDVIASESGTAKTVFYRYFADRAGLQDAVGEWAMATIEKSLAAARLSTDTPRDQLSAMVRAFVELAAGSPALYRFALGSKAVASGPEGAVDSVASLLVSVIHGPREAGSAGSSAWAAGAVGMVRGSVDWWLTHGETTPAAIDTLVADITTWLWATQESTHPREES